MTITAELPALTEAAAPCPGDHDADWHPAGAPVWCLDHSRMIEARLQRIPRLAAEVAIRRDGALVKGAESPLEIVTKALDPASPSPAWDAVDAVLRWARWWRDTLAQQIGRWDHDHGAVTPAWLPAHDLADDVDYLGRYLTPLLVGPDAVAAGQAVLSMASNLERGAGQESAKHALSAPCPKCDRLSLWRLDGSERVECAAPGCSLVMDWSEYELAAARLADQARGLRRGGAA